MGGTRVDAAEGERGAERKHTRSSRCELVSLERRRETYRACIRGGVGVRAAVQLRGDPAHLVVLAAPPLGERAVQ